MVSAGDGCCNVAAAYVVVVVRAGDSCCIVAAAYVVATCFLLFLVALCLPAPDSSEDS